MSFIRFPNTDLTHQGDYGSRRNTQNINDCINQCNNDNKCASFAYVTTNKYCYFKQNVSNPTFSSRTNVDLYMKSPIQSNQSDRTQIDNKVAEIYGAQGTNSAAFEENYRTTMLVGVVWAMLGTTILYYTFKNL